jgi:hypothetical protein
MDGMMTVIVAAGIAAVVGAVVGLIISRVMSLSSGLTIGAAVLFALAAGGVGFFLAKQDLLPRQAFDKARKDIETVPEVRVMRQYYPADYAKLQNDLEMVKGDRIGATGVRQMVRANANALLLREARKANDANLIQLMTLRRDKARALAGRSVSWCYDFTRGTRLSFDPDTVVDPAIVERERAATAAILTQTATAPMLEAAGAKKDQYTLKSRVEQYYEVELRDQVATRVAASFQPAEQETIISLAGRNVTVTDSARQSLLCRYNIALLDETLKLAPDKAAMVYRLNLGKGL